VLFYYEDDKNYEDNADNGLNYAIACKHNCCATTNVANDKEKADYIDYDTDNKDDADDVQALQINTILFKSLMRTFSFTCELSLLGRCIQANRLHALASTESCSLTMSK